MSKLIIFDILEISFINLFLFTSISDIKGTFILIKHSHDAFLVSKL